MRPGGIVEWLRLEGFIKELFDVAVIPGSRCPMALGVGTPEVQHTISFEPEFGPLSLDSILPKQTEVMPPTVQGAPPAQPAKELAASE